MNYADGFQHVYSDAIMPNITKALASMSCLASHLTPCVGEVTSAAKDLFKKVGPGAMLTFMLLGGTSAHAQYYGSNPAGNVQLGKDIAGVVRYPVDMANKIQRPYQDQSVADNIGGIIGALAGPKSAGYAAAAGVLAASYGMDAIAGRIGSNNQPQQQQQRSQSQSYPQAQNYPQSQSYPQQTNQQNTQQVSSNVDNDIVRRFQLNMQSFADNAELAKMDGRFDLVNENCNKAQAMSARFGFNLRAPNAESRLYAVCLPLQNQPTSYSR